MKAIELDEQLLIFRVGPIACCVAARDIDSIVPAQALHALPRQADYIAGVMQYRESAVSVVNLFHKFSLSTPDSPEQGNFIMAYTRHGVTGFWVDDVLEITSAYDKQWSDSPAFIDDQVFDKTLLWHEKLVLQTDFDRLFAMKTADALSEWASQNAQDWDFRSSDAQQTNSTVASQTESYQPADSEQIIHELVTRGTKFSQPLISEITSFDEDSVLTAIVEPDTSLAEQELSIGLEDVFEQSTILEEAANEIIPTGTVEQESVIEDNSSEGADVEDGQSSVIPDTETDKTSEVSTLAFDPDETITMPVNEDINTSDREVESIQSAASSFQATEQLAGEDVSSILTQESDSDSMKSEQLESSPTEIISQSLMEDEGDFNTVEEQDSTGFKTTTDISDDTDFELLPPDKNFTCFVTEYDSEAVSTQLSETVDDDQLSIHFSSAEISEQVPSETSKPEKEEEIFSLATDPVAYEVLQVEEKTEEKPDTINDDQLWFDFSIEHKPESVVTELTEPEKEDSFIHSAKVKSYIVEENEDIDFISPFDDETVSLGFIEEDDDHSPLTEYDQESIHSVPLYETEITPSYPSEEKTLIVDPEAEKFEEDVSGFFNKLLGEQVAEYQKSVAEQKAKQEKQKLEQKKAVLVQQEQVAEISTPGLFDSIFSEVESDYPQDEDNAFDADVVTDIISDGVRDEVDIVGFSEVDMDSSADTSVENDIFRTDSENISEFSSFDNSQYVVENQSIDEISKQKKEEAVRKVLQRIEKNTPQKSNVFRFRLIASVLLVATGVFVAEHYGLLPDSVSTTAIKEITLLSEAEPESAEQGKINPAPLKPSSSKQAQLNDLNLVIETVTEKFGEQLSVLKHHDEIAEETKVTEYDKATVKAPVEIEKPEINLPVIEVPVKHDVEKAETTQAENLAISAATVHADLPAPENYAPLVSPVPEKFNQVIPEHNVNKSLSAGNYQFSIYQVVRGDTLWAIAGTYLHNPFRYPDLARWSNIKNPDLIYPGDKVKYIPPESNAIQNK